MLDALITPFAEFEFMQRALVGVIAIAIGGGPVGVFLMLRRMSLTGDAMAHAILPGAAVGYLVAGLSLPAMALGGLVAGVVVAMLAGAVARYTSQKEDASLAAFYLISLALGVSIVSLKGSNVDLLHVLFGSILALDDASLILLAGVATVTLVTLALLFRPLVVECIDPTFLRSVSGAGTPTHLIFLGLVVLNLVGGFVEPPSRCSGDRKGEFSLGGGVLNEVSVLARQRQREAGWVVIVRDRRLAPFRLGGQRR